LPPCYNRKWLEVVHISNFDLGSPLSHI
jgi:hypothetical protein